MTKDELLAECKAWRKVAEYYLGEFALRATPAECRKEAFRRATEHATPDEIKLIASLQVRLARATVDAALVRAEERERCAKVADGVFAPTTVSGICIECGRWTPARNPERHGHAVGCSWAEREAWGDEGIAARIRSLPSPSPGEKCEECHGEGYHIVDASTENEIVQDTRECDECGGTGTKAARKVGL